MSEYDDVRGTWREWQKILNSKPPRYSMDRPRVPVRARIIWERDGVEWVDGQALRRDPVDGAIFVEVKDRRCAIIGTWLDPADVWWQGRPANHSSASSDA